MVNDVKNYYVVDDDGVVLEKIKNNKKNKQLITEMERKYNDRSRERFSKPINEDGVDDGRKLGNSIQYEKSQKSKDIYGHQLLSKHDI